MSIRQVGCPATVAYDAATLAFLHALPFGAHEVEPPFRWCELDPGHEGDHYTLGQHSGEDQWWVRWPYGTDRPTALLRLDTCLTESLPAADGETEICTLFAEHPGRHIFEYDLGLTPAR